MIENELSELITQLVGEAPEGLEWMSYLGSWILVFIGIGLVCFTISNLFKMFSK